jgi:membrane protease YdiL (CAAX protease family)
MPDVRTRGAQAVLATIEVLGVLGGCIVVTLALTFPFLPREERLEIQLQPEPGRVAATGTELLAAVEEAEFAEQADLFQDLDGKRLVLVGEDLDRARSELPLLARDFGYLSGEAESRRILRPETIVRNAARLVLSLQAAVFLVAGVVLLRLRVPTDPAWHGRPIRVALPVGIAAGLAAFVVGLAVSVLLHVLGLPVQEQAWVVDLLADRDELIRLVPWIVFIVPLSEEVFFRGYVFRLLRRRAGLRVGLIVSSALFALVHFNPSGAVVYFGIGLLLALAYERTGSLWAPVAGHATHNALTLLGFTIFPPA